MSVFHVRHYTVRLRHSQRLRYRIVRVAWQGARVLRRQIQRLARVTRCSLVAKARVTRANRGRLQIAASKRRSPSRPS